MASTLLELRKQAGFRNAKDFAAAEGIATATYARYESAPEKIPLKAAWQLADRFGVPIDVIVSREHVDVADLRSEVQDAYDNLSKQSQASLQDYLAFLTQRDACEDRKREAEERRRCDALCYRLEQVFLSRLESEDPELFAFGSGKQLREKFEAFVAERANEYNESGTHASVAQIIAAYDRAHGTIKTGDQALDYTVIDLRNPDIQARYESAQKSANQ